MRAKMVHIGMVKFSSRENAKGKTFFRIPLVTTISKMTVFDFNEIGNRYYNKGKYGKAMKKYEKAAKLPFHPYPNNYGVLISLGNVHVMMNDYAKARAYYEKLLEAPDKKNQCEGYRNLGNVHFYEKNYAKAIECYEKIRKAYPEFITSSGLYGINRRLAEFYDAAGMKGKAVEIAPDFYKRPMTNWLAKPCGMSNYVGTAAKNPLTEDRIRILTGG